MFRKRASDRLFIVVPTIEYGGYSLVRAITARTPGYLDNPGREHPLHDPRGHRIHLPPAPRDPGPPPHPRPTPPPGRMHPLGMRARLPQPITVRRTAAKIAAWP